MKLSRHFVGVSAVALLGPLLFITAYGQQANGPGSEASPSAVALGADRLAEVDLLFAEYEAAEKKYVASRLEIPRSSANGTLEP